MLAKLIGAAIAAGVLALAVPAGAAARERTVSFGPNGYVKMGHPASEWTGSAHLLGLDPGHYYVFVRQDDYVHGHLGGSASNTLCEFDVVKSGDPGDCHGSAGKKLVKSRWTNHTYVTVDRSENGTGVDVLEGRFTA